MVCPNNSEHKIVLIEYGYGSPQRYDGVSEIKCLDCNQRFGRWCKQILEEDELEPRFCEEMGHPKINK